MTSGQQRALQELKRLQAADPDGFSVAGEASLQNNVLVATVSIRVGVIESAPGGLDLREREEFILHVPKGFPFDRPWLTVEHDRFASFPHVIWVHTICLYRNSADWVPRDGLYGFFDKLRAWLWKAAINDMDPVDVPLEPPHHVTAFSQRPYVIRADAPALPGNLWLGFAQLEHHPNRIEVVGWTESPDHWPEGREPALAVMLPAPLPMEFPRNGRDFFRELDKQNIDRQMVLRFLAWAALLTPSGEPIHLVLGLPMRRARDGSPRLHIAVWTTSPAFSKALRLTLEKEGDTPSLTDIRAELADSIASLLEDDEIVWCRILEDRPEIVARRDETAAVSWFRGKRVLLLGCGALGGWTAEIIVRAGATSVHLVDNGIVKPGLLARQNFRLADIGANKAQALASRLRDIARGVSCESFDRDANRFLVEAPDRLLGYDAVIDCTASSIVQMKLERDWATFGRTTPPMLSMGIDANARHCLAVTVPANSPGGIWDAYVQLKQRLCIANTSREVLDSFYSDRASRNLIQPEPGCSDPTFSGSTADVAGLACNALNMAVPHLAMNQVPCGIAFSSPMPATTRVPADVLTLDGFQEVRAGQYRIRVARNVHRESRAWVQQNNRKRSPQHETGGLLWGLWDDAIEVIWLLDASGPPADSKHEPGRFVCGIDGTADEHKRRLALTRGTCGFVGMWHTHPDMPSEQSATDVAGMAALVAGVGQNLRRALMLIYGRRDGQPTAGFFVYDSQAREQRTEFVSLGIGHLSLEAAVV